MLEGRVGFGGDVPRRMWLVRGARVPWSVFNSFLLHDYKLLSFITRIIIKSSLNCWPFIMFLFCFKFNLIASASSSTDLLPIYFPLVTYSYLHISSSHDDIFIYMSN